MSEQASDRIPTEINLHSKSRLLVIAFADGKRFELPCEYLRVFSRAKEVRTLENPVVGKEEVNITAIEPQGQYAVRLVFDDGHDTGIYSWDTLYELGEHQEENWRAYLEQLEKIGYRRRQPGEEGPKTVNLLYFTYLVKAFGREAETVQVPPTVETVEGLLEWLRRQKRDKAHLLKEGSVRITVNRQFAEPFTRIDHGDEVAIVPTSPIAPTPDEG